MERDTKVNLLRELLQNGTLDQVLRDVQKRRNVNPFDDFRAGVLERLWVNHNSFRGDSELEFLGWCRVIARRMASDLRAKHQRTLRVVAHFGGGLGSTVIEGESRDDGAWASDDVSSAAKLLFNSLGLKEQQVIGLMYFTEFSSRAVAAMLQISNANLRQIHHRAIVKLRKRIGAEKSPKNSCVTSGRK